MPQSDLPLPGNAPDTPAGDEPLSKLEQALDDRRPHVRLGAVAALGRRNSPAAVGVLCDALRSRDRAVRQEAARVLGRVGGAEAAHALCGALADRQPAVRDQAAAALAEIGAAAVEPLCGALENWRSWRAADVLCEISDLRAVGPLCAALERGYMPNAWRVVEWLGETADPSAVPVLCRFLNDRGPVGVAAVAAIGKLADPRAIDALARALNAEVQPGRSRIVAALGAIGGPQALEVLRSRLVETGASPFAELDTEELRELEAALIQIGPQVVGRMLPLLNSSPAVRLSAVRVVGAFAAPAAVEPLCAVLSDRNPLIRRHAVQALAQIGDTRAIEPLVYLLDDCDTGVREQAVVALESLGWQPQDVRSRVLVALARGDDAAAGVEGEAALDTLLPLLRSDDSELRAAAAQALGWTVCRAAVPALRERLHWFAGEQHGPVRQAIHAAIRRIEAATAGTSSLPRCEPNGLEPGGRPRTDEQSPARDGRPRTS